MRLCENVCLDEMVDEFENGSKSRSVGQIFEKPCVRSRGHIFIRIFTKLCQNICLDKISDELERGHGQNLEKPCACSICHNFCPIIVKLGKNVYLDEIENGSCPVKK